MNSWGLFLARKLTCGKRESVSSQHSDKKIDEQWDCWTLSLPAKKNESQRTGGGGEGTTPVSPRLIQKLESRSACRKKKEKKKMKQGRVGVNLCFYFVISPLACFLPGFVLYFVSFVALLRCARFRLKTGLKMLRTSMWAWHHLRSLTFQFHIFFFNVFSWCTIVHNNDMRYVPVRGMWAWHVRSLTFQFHFFFFSFFFLMNARFSVIYVTYQYVGMTRTFVDFPIHFTYFTFFSWCTIFYEYTHNVPHTRTTGGHDTYVRWTFQFTFYFLYLLDARFTTI